jgi:hypothetical protein
MTTSNKPKTNPDIKIPLPNPNPQQN